MTEHNVYDKLKELGIELPPAGTPGAVYVMAVQTGNLLFVSGHTAKKDGRPWVGKLGATISTEEGQLAARSVAISLLSTIHDQIGDLNRVKRIVKMMSLVNSTLEYTDHHLVTNGASELLVQVFGEKGKHARSAFGIAQIPTGSCVEIELVVELA